MSTAVKRALYGKLAGDTTLNNLLGAAAPNYTKSIYYQQAPAGATFPLVIFSKQSGQPTEAFTDPSAFENDIWLVKGVNESNSADVVESIAARVAVLLNDTTLTISGSTLCYLRRQSDVDYAEDDQGRQYKHSGSLFRLITTD